MPDQRSEPVGVAEERDVLEAGTGPGTPDGGARRMMPAGDGSHRYPGEGQAGAAGVIRTGEQSADSASDEVIEQAEEPLVLVDHNPETLVDERRTEAHPEQFGHPGRPLGRSSPFVFGFFAALGVLLAIGLTQALLSARSVLVLIVVSLFLAVGLNPLVERLIRAGLRRGLAVVCVFVGTILAFVGFGLVIVPPVVEQTQTLVQNLPTAVSELQRSELLNRLNANYGVLDRLQSSVSPGAIGGQVAGGLLGVGKLLVSTVFSTLTVLILTLYFLASLPSIKRQVYRLVPATRRERVSLLGDEILLRIGGYVSGAATVAFIAGVTAFVFLFVAGMPYPAALALFTGAMSLIPMVGATVAMVVVGTVGFFQSVALGVACLIYYTIYQQVENYLVYPRVMRRTVDVPAAMTVIAALVGGTLLGVVGALLAIPTAAAILLIVNEVLLPRQDQA